MTCDEWNIYILFYNLKHLRLQCNAIMFLQFQFNGEDSLLFQVCVAMGNNFKSIFWPIPNNFFLLVLSNPYLKLRLAKHHFQLIKHNWNFAFEANIFSLRERIIELCNSYFDSNYIDLTFSKFEMYKTHMVVAL